MSAHIVWHGDRVKAQIAQTLEARLDQIGALGERDIKRMISAGQPPSKPGEPPHVMTGELRRKIAWEREGGRLRIGTNAEHAKWLELGTRRMAARPFLRPWLDASKPDIERILGRKVTEASVGAAL